MPDIQPTDKPQVARQKRLLEYWQVTKDVKEAARLAGYSETYINAQLIYELRRAPGWRKLILEEGDEMVHLYVNLLKTHGLPAILQADIDTLTQAAADPEFKQKHESLYTKTAERALRATGVVRSDTQAQPTVTNIINLPIYQQMLQCVFNPDNPVITQANDK